MKRMLKRGIAFLLAWMLAIPCLGVVQPQAAAKNPSLSSKSMTIGVGKFDQGKKMASGNRDYNTLEVKNTKKGAKYTFTTSDKKVVTASGSKGVATITGVKAGTATITVKQTYKGKTTTVGSCKVTVKKATVGSTTMTKKVLIGNDIDANEYIEGFLINIAYMNAAAKYTFKSSSDGFKMSQKQTYGGAYQTYTATKAGTYHVTVTETYKKKSRTVGTVKVTVLPVTLASTTATLYVNDEDGLNLNRLLKNGDYTSVLAEVATEEYKDAVTTGQYYGEYVMDTVLFSTREGEMKLNLYIQKANGKKGDLIGSCTVTMKTAVVKEIKVPSSITMEVGDERYLFGNYDSDDDEVEYGVFMESEEMPVPAITCSSSDTSIVSADEVGYLYAGEKTGTATVTITCGGITKEVEVTVTPISEDDDDDYYYDDDDDYYDDDDF
jgi:hypothetical protein